MSEVAQMENRFVPTREEFLKEIASGKSINKLERSWNMNAGSLHYWVGKWELRGIKPDRAQQLLDEMAVSETGDKTPVTGLKDLNASREAEVKLLREKDVLPPNTEQEELRLLRKRLEDVDQIRHNATEAHAAVQSRMQERIEQLEDLLQQSEDDRKTLRDMLERQASAESGATPDPTQNPGDPVSHPAHYTAGAVECIDAIEAAVMGLPGGQAYATGAAIKYLWRWSRKNGVEDLRKARWYLDRLIGEVGEK